MLANHSSRDLTKKPVISTSRFRIDLRGKDTDLAALFAAFVLLSLLYRGIVDYALHGPRMNALGFDPILVSHISFWGCLRSDCVAGFMVTAVFALVGACV